MFCYKRADESIWTFERGEAAVQEVGESWDEGNIVLTICKTLGDQVEDRTGETLALMLGGDIS